MKYLICLVFLVINTNAQYRDYENLHLDRTFWILEEVMKRGDDLEKMVEFLSDTSITSTDREIRFQNNIQEYVIPNSKDLIKHISINRFLDGYVIEKQQLENFAQDRLDKETMKEFELRYLIFAIKIRSNSTKDIIWFEFDNHDGGVWKLQVFYFCNNAQYYDIDEPCDKK